MKNLLYIDSLLYIMAVKDCRDKLTEIKYRYQSANENNGCSVSRGSGPYPQSKDIQHLPL